MNLKKTTIMATDPAREVRQHGLRCRMSKLDLSRLDEKSKHLLWKRHANVDHHGQV